MFQAIGWGVFALLNIYISFLTNELNLAVTVINICISIAGIIISHAYRNYIIRHNWFVRSTEYLLKSVLLSCIIMSTLLMLVYIILLIIVLKQAIYLYQFDVLGGAWISVFVLFGIWNAFYFSWIYVEKNRNNLIERLQLETHMKDLEIKTMKANLQPHFIFNALNSIRALVDEDPQLAREAITKMSNILRSTIAKQEEMDTLDNELKLVEDYLALEKIRFEERLQFSQQIAPETRQIQIPTMMLQTLIENSVKHGISMLSAGGIIEVASYLNEGFLCIEVKNSGSLQIKNEHSLGFGIATTRERLLLLYKKQAHFNIFEKDGYVFVHIKIPYIS